MREHKNDEILHTPLRIHTLHSILETDALVSWTRLWGLKGALPELFPGREDYPECLQLKSAGLELYQITERVS